MLPRIAGMVGAAVLAGCLPTIPFDEAGWDRTVEATRAADLYADHRRDDGRFFNPWLTVDRGSFWRWAASRNSVPELHETEWPVPVVPNDGVYLSEKARVPSLTHVGHATFAVHWDDQVVVTDPFFSDRAAIIKREVPPAFEAEAIPAGAVVVISHNHYDHLDKASVQALADRARFLCPLGLGDLLRDYGAKDVRELDWWESVEVGGTVFHCLPAQHWSRRLFQGRNETLWCSWMIERGGHTVYYGADSGYFKGYEEFGRRFPGIDVALLPIGAYEPRWFMHYAHVDIPEVLQALEDLGAAVMVPTQWGVLELGDEPAAWPAEDLRRALGTTHPDLADRVRILGVGEVMALE